MRQFQTILYLISPTVSGIQHPRNEQINEMDGGFFCFSPKLKPEVTTSQFAQLPVTAAIRPQYHGDVWGVQPRCFLQRRKGKKKKKQRERGQPANCQQTVLVCDGWGRYAVRTQKCGSWWGAKAAGEKTLKTHVTVTEINPAVTKQGALIPRLEVWGRPAPGCQGKQPLDSGYLLDSKEQI